MTDVMANKISFYKLLKENPVGYKKELKEKFEESNGTNFDEIYDSSMRVGVLRAGIDGIFEDRYKVTDFGKRQIMAFVELYEYLQSNNRL